MALVVEDGTGKADAESYVSVEDCTSYATARDITDWLNTANDQEAALRRATAFLDKSFVWKGYKTWGRAQALAWPRVEVLDEEDNEVLGTEIPVEVIQATCELAAYEAANPGGLNPTVTPSTFVTRERVGEIEVNYAAPGGAVDSARPVLLGVRDLVAGLLAQGQPGSISGVAVRV